MTTQSVRCGTRPVAARPGAALALILTCQLMLMLDVTVMNGFSPAGIRLVALIR